VAADIRALIRARATVQQLQLADRNRLHGLLSLVFPEFLTVMKGVMSQSAQYLLLHYPTPPLLVKADVRQLTRELRRISRGRIGSARLTHLVQAARQTIGVGPGSAGYAVAISQCAERLRTSHQHLTALESQLAALLVQVPDMAVLFSMKGVGVITVATLVGEVGSFHAFPSRAALFKFVGLNLFEISSGQRRGHRRISKRGSSRVRHVLYLAAVNMTGTDGLYDAYYQRLRARGQSVRAARTAVMRKVLGVMYALVRDQREYRQQEEIAKAA
jgi:transposase